MTTAPDPTPIPTPWPQRLEDLRRRQVPIVVWTVATLVCGFLLFSRSSHLEYVALAQSLTYEVSAEANGRIESVIVEVYDDVRAGDVVAKLDDALMTAQLETTAASIRQLAAELEAARERLLVEGHSEHAGFNRDLRRFRVDEEKMRLDGLALRVTIESDAIELERLALELERAGPLLESGVIARNEHDQVRLEHDVVRRRLEENRVLLAQTHAEHEAAVRRREEFESRLPAVPDQEPLLQPLQAAITVETSRLAELEVVRNGLYLRSPVDGQVSQVYCRVGQSVVPGEPILTITDRSVREVVTYLDESATASVAPSSPVLLASRRRPQRAVESIVLRVGPGVELMPQRLWRNPAIPDYGRPVVIAALPALDVTPGELLSVRFLDDRR